MEVVALEINQTSLTTEFHENNTKNMKALHYWPFARGTSIMGKTCQCHDASMFQVTWVVLWDSFWAPASWPCVNFLIFLSITASESYALNEGFRVKVRQLEERVYRRRSDANALSLKINFSFSYSRFIICDIMILCGNIRSWIKVLSSKHFVCSIVGSLTLYHQIVFLADRSHSFGLEEEKDNDKTHILI